MKIFKQKNFKILTIVFFLNFFAKNLFAFGGSMAGGSMGRGGMGDSGNSGPKSGISIVDPQGKSFNCQPFVDQKWESTNFEDSWNGVYFSIGAEISKFSGDFKISDSKIGNIFDSTYIIPDFDKEKRNFKFSGQNKSPFITVGGGMLIDRVYLATDLEIRASNMSSTIDVVLNEKHKDPANDKFDIKSKMQYDIKNYVMYNAKIGYLINDRSLIYFNAGLGSFSSYDISMKDYGINVEDTSTSPPIRLSIGSEFALSNHFRLYGDFSHWVIPQIQGNFSIKPKELPSNFHGTDVSFNSRLKINSTKIGILYRF
jgi:opacity protein-like surface antigen